MTMWKATILVALAAFVSGEKCVYKGYECPEHRMVEQHNPKCEIRSYESITWATTSEACGEKAENEAFKRLFDYIKGENVPEQKIQMTVPVRTHILETDGDCRLTMAFMVPSEMAEDPPAPKDDQVEIVEEGPTEYAVWTFDGFATEKEWLEAVENLKECINDDDAVDQSSYYQVGYESPFDLNDRRNEVWMPKETSEE